MEEIHFIKDTRQYDSRTAALCWSAPRGPCVQPSQAHPTEEAAGQWPEGGQPEADTSLQRLFWDSLPVGGKWKGCVLHQVPVLRQHPGHTQDRQPRSSIPTLCQLRTRGQRGDALEYNPYLLDDSWGPCGKHKHCHHVHLLHLHDDRVREALQPQEGQERNLPRKVPAYRANAKQD